MPSASGIFHAILRGQTWQTQPVAKQMVSDGHGEEISFAAVDFNIIRKIILPIIAT